MITVLIVEDEYRVGLLIKSLINWAQFPLKLMGIIENGEEAWEKIQTSSPDIVITDIRMPKMDGLELIRLSKQRNPDIKFVVISGYRHFDYAHQALKYGVVDYLLKPINQKELNDILNKIILEKEFQLEQLQIKERTEATYSKSSEILHRELVEQLIEDSIPSDDMLVINKEYNVDFQQGIFQAVQIKIDPKIITDEIDVIQNNVIFGKVMDIIESQLIPITSELITITRENGLFICILNHVEKNKNEMNKVLGTLLTSIHDYIFAFKDYEVTLAIGKSVYNIKDLPDSIQTSSLALMYRIEKGIGRKIYYNDHQYEKILGSIVSYLNIRTPITRCVESLDVTCLKREIDNAISQLSDFKNIDPSYYYELGKGIVNLAFDQIQNVEQVKNAYNKDQVESVIDNIYSIEILREFLQESLGDMLQYYREQHESLSRKPILEAKKYLSDHYMEKVSLNDLSNIVNLNPTYFSALFKKETGSNFSDYLINLRIEAAKDVLRQTNKTIMAVALDVGYEDTKYFTQLFKKKVGINPTLYRKLYS